jgi:hypothetical protein
VAEVRAHESDDEGDAAPDDKLKRLDAVGSRRATRSRRAALVGAAGEQQVVEPEHELGCDGVDDVALFPEGAREEHVELAAHGGQQAAHKHERIRERVDGGDEGLALVHGEHRRAEQHLQMVRTQRVSTWVEVTV